MSEKRNEFVFSGLGASNHSKGERPFDDYYATDPKAIEKLLDQTDIQLNHNVWECACGGGHLSEVLKSRGFKVYSTDVTKRYEKLDEYVDFLNDPKLNDGFVFDGDILTNPPFKFAEAFIRKGLSIVNEGSKILMFLRIQFIEGKNRFELFKEHPPKEIYVPVNRITCIKNGEGSFKGGAMCLAWFVWEKGFKGDTVVKWFNY